MRLRKRIISLVLAVAMVLTLVPMNADAAALPKWKKEYANVYENSSAKGVYTYTINNVKKGYKVKYSISGEGKAYVTLANKSVVAKKKTVSNKITVNSKGEDNAKDKAFIITAKVYNGKKLITKLTTGSTIRIVCKSIEAVGKTSLFVNDSASYEYEVTPENTTFRVFWSAYTTAGVDVSYLISEDGTFTPDEVGTYVVKATAINDITGAKKEASVNVNVTNPIKSVVQSATNAVQVSYYGDVADIYTKDSFKITGTSSGVNIIKEISFSGDGKTVTIITTNNFNDKESYSVYDGSTTKAFTASLGKPKTLSIITSAVTVGRPSVIKYAVLDENGIDVTSIYPGKIKYTTSLNNAIDEATNKITITTVGVSATVAAEYTESNLGITLVATGTITCASADRAKSTNFTITSDTAVPNYDAADYKDVRKLTTGNAGYIHFRGLDQDGTAYEYATLAYTSSNPDIISVSASGKVQSYQSGKVTITVTATYAGQSYSYYYDVEARAAEYLDILNLSKNTVEISNIYDLSYQEKIFLESYDQYGEKFPLTDEKATITKLSGTSNVYPSYDSINNCINITARSAAAGTNTYRITVTSGTKVVTADFTVIVSQVPTTGTMTYVPVIEKNSYDLTVANNATSYLTTTVRLASYKGGVFAGYTSMNNVTITKDNKYYGRDLTQGGNTTIQTITGSTSVTLTLMDLFNKTIRKAEAGTYTIAVNYYSKDNNGYVTSNLTLTLTDKDVVPALNVVRTTSSETKKTALELVKDCITVNTGEIIDCTVYGVATNGSTVTAAGENYNITSVKISVPYKVNNETIYMYYNITLGKTLLNKPAAN